MSGLGYRCDDLRRLVLFIDPTEPSRPSGVHLVSAGRKVRPSHLYPAPSLDESVRSDENFWVLDLPALLRMKLTSLQNPDKSHVEDLIRVGMIDAELRASLPTELRDRLDAIERGLDDE